MSKAETAVEILGEIEKISVIDSHEHLEPEAERVKRDTDVLEIIGNYVTGDLYAAGCPPEVAEKIVDPKGEIGPRWELLAPYWPKIRNGSYARMWTRTLKDLFDCQEMSAAALAEATEKMRRANKPGWYKEVLKERCNIAISVLDYTDVAGADCDRELFVPVMRATQFIEARTKQQVEGLSANTDRAIHSLHHLVAGNRPGPQRQEQSSPRLIRPPRNRPTGRQPFPVEMLPQHRRLAPRRPGAPHARPLRKAALIDENYRRTGAHRPLFISGQSWRFHLAMPGSACSLARRAGFWQLQPIARRILKT